MLELNYTTPPVAIVGYSGTGKSTAIESLPADRTIVLNPENKMMPFRSHNKFTVIDVKEWNVFLDVLNQLESEEGVKNFDYVVVDSFTSLTEMIERYANFAFSGFNQWKEYNAMITEVIIRIKRLPQQVFFIGIPEQKDVEFGDVKLFLKVKGKELKYQVEKEFSVVLFTDPVYDDMSGEMIDVLMSYKPNKKNTAKSPNGMFTTKPHNNMLEIANAIKEYYKED